MKYEKQQKWFFGKACFAKEMQTAWRKIEVE
jgi:hypothetical protein